MSDRIQVTREKLMQFSKEELVEELLGALAVVVSLKTTPEEGETMLKIIKSQSQQIIDGRTIYDAAHRENNQLRAALQSIASKCPATCDMTLAHEMAEEAETALALSRPLSGSGK